MPSTCATSRVAAFFDFDNTLLPGHSSELRFFLYLWRKGVVGWSEMRDSVTCLVKQRTLSSLQPLRERKIYLRGKRPSEIEPFADEFCRHELCPRLSKDGLERMDAHRRAGHHIILLTGSLDFLVAPLARWLGIETVLAAIPERLNDRYTGDVVPPLPYGLGKRHLVNDVARDLGLDLKACYAYGDSPGDEATLQLVGHPLVINPIRGMRGIARRHRWPTVRWK